MVVRNGEPRARIAATIPRSLRQSLDRDLVRWITKERKTHKLAELVTLVFRLGLPLAEKELGLRENGDR
jgi:hypothetical protein